jgi:hypothetical protein
MQIADVVQRIAAMMKFDAHVEALGQVRGLAGRRCIIPGEERQRNMIQRHPAFPCPCPGRRPGGPSGVAAMLVVAHHG